MSPLVELPVFRWGSRADRKALVDADALDLIGGKRLALNGDYAHAGSIQLHRLVMGLTRGDGKVCHHINEDTLDCRRANLQIFDSRREHGAAPHPLRDLISHAQTAEEIAEAQRKVAASIRNTRVQVLAEAGVAA